MAKLTRHTIPANPEPESNKNKLSTRPVPSHEDESVVHILMFPSGWPAEKGIIMLHPPPTAPMLGRGSEVQHLTSMGVSEN